MCAYVWPALFRRVHPRWKKDKIKNIAGSCNPYNEHRCIDCRQCRVVNLPTQISNRRNGSRNVCFLTAILHDMLSLLLMW